MKYIFTLLLFVISTMLIAFLENPYDWYFFVILLMIFACTNVYYLSQQLDPKNILERSAVVLTLVYFVGFTCYCSVHWFITSLPIIYVYTIWFSFIIGLIFIITTKNYLIINDDIVKDTCFLCLRVPRNNIEIFKTLMCLPYTYIGIYVETNLSTLLFYWDRNKNTSGITTSINKNEFIIINLKLPITKRLISLCTIMTRENKTFLWDTLKFPDFNKAMKLELKGVE